MALKTLLLRSKLEKAIAELEKLRAKDADFKTRQAELEAALGEVNSETTVEEQEALEEQIEAFDSEQNAHEETKRGLETQIADFESEIAEEEKRTSEVISAPQKRKEKGKEEMNTKTKFFGMTYDERDRFFMRDDIKDFTKRMIDIISQKRAVSGAELSIPTVILPLIKEKTEENSKLLKHINLLNISGKARQTVMGVIPEAIWTEAYSSLNEVDIDFTGIEVDGYKVGGFIPVNNSLLEDEDNAEINLMTEIITALGKSIGIAVDKAIIYGTGIKMPLGIVTRIMQTSEPNNYPSDAREWKDISETNAIKISGKTDLALYKAFVEATGNLKSEYSTGAKFWAMNDKTYTKMLSNTLSINATGAVAAGMNKEMPVVGGTVEILNFIPDGVIVGGYGDTYLLAKRGGTTLEFSPHARFIQDQTVFKGVERYDGMPVIAESFVAIDINGKDISALDVTFTADSPNATFGGDDE